MKKSSNDRNRQSVRDLKQKRFKKKIHSHSFSKNDNYAIVRVMGHDQFKVNSRIAKKINKIDNDLIKIIQSHDQGEKDYAKRVAQVPGLIKKIGSPVDHKEIIQSDIIVRELTFLSKTPKMCSEAKTL